MEYNIILPKQPKIIKKGNNRSIFEIDIFCFTKCFRRCYSYNFKFKEN